MLLSLGNDDDGSRGPVSCGHGMHTLVMVLAPFRNPLRVRVERKHDLANMTGKLASVCRERAAIG